MSSSFPPKTADQMGHDSASWATIMKMLRCRPFRWQRLEVDEEPLSEEEITHLLNEIPTPSAQWRDRVVSEVMAYLSGLTSAAETVYMSMDGHWVRFTAVREQRHASNVTLLVGATQDVHEEYRVHEQQHKTARWMKALVEQLPEAVVVWNNGREVLRNRRAEQLLSNAPEAVGLGGLLSQIDAEDRAAVLAHLRSAQAGGTVSAEVARLGGMWLEFSSSSIQTDDGLMVLTVFRDITERRQMERHLAIQERMATVGTLAAGVAHEINNPLCFIQLNLELLREELPEMLEALKRNPQNQQRLFDDLLAKLDDTIVGTGRVQEVVSDLMVFSHTESSEETSSADVVQSIQLAINLGHHRVKHKAALQFDSTLPIAVRGQVGLLSQVFLNLIVNASDAIEEAGIENGKINIQIRHLPGQVEINVIDNGPGIPADVLPRLFDPFFTTKKVGKGSGLGLSISHSIIERCGGTLQVTNPASGGACFQVRLPLVDIALPEDITDEVTQQITALKNQLLIIDDEEMLLRALERGLSGDFDVTTTQSGAHAIELIKKGLDPDLILLDIMMPDQDGSQVYQWLVNHRPQYADRILVMTGGAVTKSTQRFLDETTATVFRKPLKIKALRAQIQEMLDR